jgi:hypothetical protein
MKEFEVRIEGPTPAGGAYAIGRFSFNGTPCRPKQANEVLTTEYSASGDIIATTYGVQTPEEPPPTAVSAVPSIDDELSTLQTALTRTEYLREPKYRRLMLQFAQIVWEKAETPDQRERVRELLAARDMSLP